MLDSSSTANSLCYEGAVLSAADLHFFQPHGFSKLLFRRLYFPHGSLYAGMEKLDLHFNGICSGFLGSKEQIEIVKSFLKSLKQKKHRSSLIR